MKGAINLNNSSFIDEMEERVLMRNHKIYFCCLLCFSLVVPSLSLKEFVIKQKKEKKK